MRHRREPAGDRRLVRRQAPEQPERRRRPLGRDDLVHRFVVPRDAGLRGRAGAHSRASSALPRAPSRRSSSPTWHSRTAYVLARRVCAVRRRLDARHDPRPDPRRRRRGHRRPRVRHRAQGRERARGRDQVRRARQRLGDRPGRRLGARPGGRPARQGADARTYGQPPLGRPRPELALHRLDVGDLPAADTDSRTARAIHDGPDSVNFDECERRACPDDTRREPAPHLGAHGRSPRARAGPGRRRGGSRGGCSRRGAGGGRGPGRRRADIVNDGEQSKTSFVGYRFAAVGLRAGVDAAEAGVPTYTWTEMEARDYPKFFSALARAGGPPRPRRRRTPARCWPAPARSAGRTSPQVERDIANLRAANEGDGAEDVFMTAISPATYAPPEPALRRRGRVPRRDRRRDEPRVRGDRRRRLRPAGRRARPGEHVPQARPDHGTSCCDDTERCVEAINHATRGAPAGPGARARLLGRRRGPAPP